MISRRSENIQRYVTNLLALKGSLRLTIIGIKRGEYYAYTPMIYSDPPLAIVTPHA